MKMSQEIVNYRLKEEKETVVRMLFKNKTEIVIKINHRLMNDKSEKGVRFSFYWKIII